jgi:GNAT superfamily N-acetyltransferase
MRLNRRPRVVIREPVAADARAIAQVLVDSWFAAYRELLPAELLAGLSVTARAKQLEAALAAPAPLGAVRLVAELGGVVIGFVNAGGTAPGDAVRADAAAVSEAELAVLYVDPEHWRQGVGRKLTRSALARLADVGFDDVSAWVIEGNAPARAFLTSQGWASSEAKRTEVMDGYQIDQTRLDFSLID